MPQHKVVAVAGPVNPVSVQQRHGRAGGGRHRISVGTVRLVDDGSGVWTLSRGSRPLTTSAGWAHSRWRSASGARSWHSPPWPRLRPVQRALRVRFGRPRPLGRRNPKQDSLIRDRRAVMLIRDRRAVRPIGWPPVRVTHRPVLASRGTPSALTEIHPLPADGEGAVRRRCGVRMPPGNPTRQPQIPLQGPREHPLRVSGRCGVAATRGPRAPCRMQHCRTAVRGGRR